MDYVGLMVSFCYLGIQVFLPFLSSFTWSFYKMNMVVFCPPTVKPCRGPILYDIIYDMQLFMELGKILFLTFCSWPNVHNFSNIFLMDPRACIEALQSLTFQYFLFLTTSNSIGSFESTLSC